jgi:DNA repair photolyase
VTTLATKDRKGRALGAGVPQCLANQGIVTLNVLSACPLECHYCKYRARSKSPTDQILRYSDLPAQLDEELAQLKRRNRVPPLALFNTVTECFIGDAQVDRCARQCLEVFFSHAIHVSLTTRGLVPPEVMGVLARRPDLITVTSTIASLAESFQRIYEPRIVPAKERLALMRQLRAVGIPVRGRIEPLIPMENDSARQLQELLAEMRGAGVREVIVSYMQMDPSVWARLRERVSRVQFSLLSPWYRTQEGELAFLLESAYRKRKYEEIKALGSKLDLRILVCACRNADMYTGRCFIVPNPVQKKQPKTLL